MDTDSPSIPNGALRPDGDTQSIADEPTRTLGSPALSPAVAASRPVPVEPPPPNIDRFTILEELGVGGMGRVYLGRDEVLGREVALKVLNPTATDVVDEFELRSEAQTMAQLSHPNLVPVYSVGTSGGRVFIAMERVHGQTLSAWLAGHSGDVASILAIFLQAGRGLAAIHRAGFSHGDFKPSNIMVEPDGRARVLDFGLTRPVKGAPMVPHTDERRLATATDESIGLEIRGTPRYMAPELWTGHQRSAQTDQFSFCVTVFRALYGRYPVDEHGQLVASTSTTGRSERPSVPPTIEDAIFRGLDPEPVQRWPSMEALLDVFELAVAPRKRGRAWLPWGIAAALGAAVWSVATIPEAVSPCVTAVGSLDGVWNGDRAQALDIGGDSDSGVGRKPVIERIDTYARTWTQTRDSVCALQPASVVGASPSSPMPAVECLERGRRTLDAYLQVLSVTPDVPPDRALAVLDELPQPERCLDDPPQLPSVSLPSDPVRAQRVEEHRDTLSRVQAMSAIGHHGDALDVVRQLSDAVDAVQYPPLTSEMLIVRGGLERWLGHYREARAHLEDGYFVAKSAGDPTLMVRAAAELMLVVGVYQGQNEGADVWARHAAAVLSQVNSPKVRARYYEYLGGIYEVADRLEEAAAAHATAIEIIEEHYGPDHSRLASSLFNAGLVQGSAGNDEEALRLFSKCLDIAERRLGPNSTRVATCLGGRGEIRGRLRQFEGANRDLERALVLFDANLGPGSPHSAIVLQSLATIAVELDEPELARVHFDEALSRWARRDEPTTRDYVALLLARARFEMDEGEYEASLGFVDLAIASAQQPVGEGPFELLALEARVRLFQRWGRDADAQAALDRAVAIAVARPEWTQELDKVRAAMAEPTPMPDSD